MKLPASPPPPSLILFPPAIQAQVYREDFETERKDRETAHAQLVELEERYKNETADLKQKLQRVSADCGRLTQQMQSERTAFQQQLEEANKNVEDLKADNQVLQVSMVCILQQYMVVKVHYQKECVTTLDSILAYRRHKYERYSYWRWCHPLEA